MNFPDQLPIRSAVFEKIRMYAEQSLALEYPGVLQNMEMEARVDHMTRRLVLSLRSVCCGKTVERIDVEAKYPADWWEAFKERWFPKWALQRWPVKYKTISVHRDVVRVCPHLPMTVSSHREHFHWLETGESRDGR